MTDRRTEGDMSGDQHGLAIDLRDARALVTGVSSGIGAGIAAALARAGADVAGCGLDDAMSAGAQVFLNGVRHANRRGWYRAIDLGTAHAPAELVAWAAETLGGIDLLVSNAGRNIFAGAARCTEAEWTDNINLNLAAHWRLAQAARPHLEHGTHPVIIVIASNHAYATLPGCFPYNVAKAGLTALVQSLALEWGPRIRTVGIAPGFVETPLSDAWFNTFADPAAKRRQIVSLHPVGRLGTPEDIGTLCAFLCSPLAGFISGSTVLIDGGRSAALQDD